MTPYAETTVRVRYAETDQMGLVYYGNYFTWFEVGRVELCRQLGFEYKQMEIEDDSFIVVAEASCRYKRPARFDDQLTIRTRVTESQRRTVRFGYEILNAVSGELIATGETLHVICDRTGKPKSLPDKYRKYFPVRATTFPTQPRPRQRTYRENPRMKFQIDGEHLTLEQLYAVVFERAEVELSAGARERMNASRAVIERLIDSNTAVYGVNTGFGKMASVRISREQIRQLQVNLVRSHACGVGAPLSESETRAMLVLRANAIAKGFSGVRPVVAETLCAMLNRGVHPVIPSQGSVGASGDLAPLAHLAQVAIGEGDASLRGPQDFGRRCDAKRRNRAARARGEGRSCAAKRDAGDACACWRWRCAKRRRPSTQPTLPPRSRSMRCEAAPRPSMRESRTFGRTLVTR